MTSLVILENALNRDELPQFILGIPPYFIEAKTDNEEPQNVAAAFDKYIYPYWITTYDPSFPQHFSDALKNAVTQCADKNKATYTVLNWIWFYLFCFDKSQKSAAYPGLFSLDLTELQALLYTQLQQQELSLKQDNRWAGAAWNSPNGLWQPITKLCQAIERLNGPIFLPLANTP
jgi:hypothetical protein